MKCPRINLSIIAFLTKSPSPPFNTSPLPPSLPLVYVPVRSPISVEIVRQFSFDTRSAKKHRSHDTGAARLGWFTFGRVAAAGRSSWKDSGFKISSRSSLSAVPMPIGASGRCALSLSAVVDRAPSSQQPCYRHLSSSSRYTRFSSRRRRRRRRCSTVPGA